MGESGILTHRPFILSVSSILATGLAKLCVLVTMKHVGKEDRMDLHFPKVAAALEASPGQGGVGVGVDPLNKANGAGAGGAGAVGRA